MLIEFSCSNHKSIREPITFSFLAGKDTTSIEKVQTVGEMKLLKSAVIYGANGSGKSNFIDAISFVKSLVMNSINHQPGQGIRHTPHKLENINTASVYQVQFLVDNIRYVFGFSLKNMLIAEEYLYYFPKGRQAKVYDRIEGKIIPGSKFRSKFSMCKEVLKPNRLLLSCAANFADIPEINDAFNFFVNDLVIYGNLIQDDWMNYSLYQMNSDAAMKKAVISFMSALGTNIKDIKVNIDQKQISLNELPPFLSDEFKNILLQNKVDSITAKIVYDSFETDLLNEESTGIKKLFGMLCPLLDILAHNKILICDELESGLHESIVYELVDFFSNGDMDSSAQIIFTTHETGLLDLDLFRRDQIWFTEMKTGDRSTDLYSLAEIKNVRKEENFVKGYMSGKYGAIPMLNLDFAKIVSKIE